MLWRIHQGYACAGPMDKDIDFAQIALQLLYNLRHAVLFSITNHMACCENNKLMLCENDKFNRDL